MIDLKDLTFNIPIRYDTPDRIQIFKAVLPYISKNMDTNIVICESDKTPKFENLCKGIPNCQYIFDQTDSEIFHRTKLINIMAKASKTPYIVNYDVDCILHLPKYLEAMHMLRTNEAEVITGFDLHTWNVPYSLQQKIIDTGNINWLNTSMCLCANTIDIAKGGIVYWNKEAFEKIGMENENYISWSCEDQSRIYVAEKLGLKYKRVPGPLYHLQHKRLLNSGPHHKFTVQNDSEYEKIKKMSVDQLWEYVKTGSWLK